MKNHLRTKYVNVSVLVNASSCYNVLHRTLWLKQYVYYVYSVSNYYYLGFQKMKEYVLIECQSKNDANEEWQSSTVINNTTCFLFFSLSKTARYTKPGRLKRILRTGYSDIPSRAA